MIQLENGSLEMNYLPGGKTAELAVDNGNEWINAVDLSPADLHQLAYHALHLANQIRSVRGNG